MLTRQLLLSSKSYRCSLADLVIHRPRQAVLAAYLSRQSLGTYLHYSQAEQSVITSF